METFNTGGYTTVLCKGDLPYTSMERGVKPLVFFVERAVLPGTIQRGNHIRMDITHLAFAPVESRHNVLIMRIAKFKESFLNRFFWQVLTVYTNGFSLAAYHINHHRHNFIYPAHINFQLRTVTVFIKKIITDICSDNIT